MISRYAHSIKNPHIIHYIKNRRYLCITCVNTTPSKLTKDTNKVTCKNCIRNLCKKISKTRKWRW